MKSFGPFYFRYECFYKVVKDHISYASKTQRSFIVHIMFLNYFLTFMLFELKYKVVKIWDY